MCKYESIPYSENASIQILMHNSNFTNIEYESTLSRYLHILLAHIRAILFLIHKLPLYT